VNLKLDIDPDIVAMMAAEVAAGERAVTAAMREAGNGLKTAWRLQITGAGLGSPIRSGARTSRDRARAWTPLSSPGPRRRSSTAPTTPAR